MEHFVQQYTIGTVQQKGAEGPFFNYTYTAAGFADEDTAKVTQALYERYAEMAWVANEETSDTADDSRGGTPFSEEKVAGKF